MPQAYGWTGTGVTAARSSHTISGHAAASVAEDRVDNLADGLGSGVLAAIRAAELSFFLRSGKCSHRDWFVAGESADLFMGGIRIAFVPDALHRRFRRSLAQRPSYCGRHGIYVRSGAATDDSPAEPVSPSHACAAAVGDPASGL